MADQEEGIPAPNPSCPSASTTSSTSATCTTSAIAIDTLKLVLF